MFVEPSLHAGVFRVVDGGSRRIVTTGGLSILHLLQRTLTSHSSLHPLHPLHTRSCRLRRHPRFFDAPQVQAYLTNQLSSLRILFCVSILKLKSKLNFESRLFHRRFLRWETLQEINERHILLANNAGWMRSREQNEWNKKKRN